jgi:hypothetical protein
MATSSGAFGRKRGALAVWHVRVVDEELDAKVIGSTKKHIEATGQKVIRDMLCKLAERRNDMNIRYKSSHMICSLINILLPFS